MKQLEVRASILAFALATANAALLAAHGPLRVVGTVEVAGKAPSAAQHKKWEGERPLGCTTVFGTAPLLMQLRLQRE